MSSSAADVKDRLAVRGYIRTRFAQNFWIDEIIQIIIDFYKNKGGSLYMFGDRYGGKKLRESHKIGEINCLTIAACKDSSLAVDTDGDVWVFGRVPVKINFSQRAISVAVGGEHSMILSSNFYIMLVLSTCIIRAI